MVFEIFIFQNFGRGNTNIGFCFVSIHHFEILEKISAFRVAGRKAD